ncbi:DUF4214 domain-containing protein [Methylobacterium sp. P31]
MATSTDGYTLQTTINLPGTIGGHGDVVTYDPDTATMWLAQSPDNNVVVIDTHTNTVKATIPNIGNANGIALTPQYAFVADVTNNTIDVIDKHNYSLVLQIPQANTTPDSVVYVPSTNQVLVASDDNNTETFINASGPFTQTAVLTLQPNPSPDGPDLAVYVASKDLVYQPDGGAMDVINPHTHNIVATWNLLSSGDAKSPVYDPITNHLLVGTNQNEVLVVDADSGIIQKTIAVPGSLDEGSIDVTARLAYFGDKSGAADVVNLDTNTLVGKLPAEKGMHTLAVDPTTTDVYVYENNRNTVDVYAPDPKQASDFGTLSHDVHSVAGEVYALYEGLFGRAPDAAGGEYWATALSSGKSLHDVTQAMLNSPEAQAHLNATDNAGFVEQVYETVLGRHGDAAGIQSHVADLNNGLSRADLVDQFVFSNEHVSEIQPGLNSGAFVADQTDAGVARLYYGLLNRAPDATGLQYLETQAHNGASLGSVAADILTSPEYTSAHQAQTNIQFVDSLYHNALGRAADPAGEQSYTQGLDTGTLTRAQVAVDIAESPEAQQHLASQVEIGWHLA